MPKIKFYDVKGKEKFESDDFELKTRMTKRGKKFFAVADAPSGIKAWRIVKELFYKENK